MWRLKVSANHNKIPKKMVEQAMTKGERKLVSIKSLKHNPAMPTGIVAKPIAQAIFASMLKPFPIKDFIHAMLILCKSLRKYINTASKVPKCIAISKAKPCSGHLNTLGTQLQWAELAMGKNSVMTCTPDPTII